jgi:hypothetical protein
MYKYEMPRKFNDLRGFLLPVWVFKDAKVGLKMPPIDGINGGISIYRQLQIPSDESKDTEIKHAKPKDKPYKLVDGGGLYLYVTAAGGKYWRYDYRYAGKRKTLAIGVYPAVTWTGIWQQ